MAAQKVLSNDKRFICFALILQELKNQIKTLNFAEDKRRIVNDFQTNIQNNTI